MKARELLKKRKLAPAQPKKYGLKRKRTASSRPGAASLLWDKCAAILGLRRPPGGAALLSGAVCQELSAARYQDHYVQTLGLFLRSHEGDFVSLRPQSMRPKTRVTHPELAFSPQVGGAELVDYQLLLRGAFCSGNKLSNDAAAAFSRTPAATWKACKHKVDAMYARVKLAFAWLNYKDSVAVTYAYIIKEMVEADSGRFGVPSSVMVVAVSGALCAPPLGFAWLA